MPLPYASIDSLFHADLPTPVPGRVVSLFNSEIVFRRSHKNRSESSSCRRRGRSSRAATAADRNRGAAGIPLAFWASSFASRFPTVDVVKASAFPAAGPTSR